MFIFFLLNGLREKYSLKALPSIPYQSSLFNNFTWNLCCFSTFNHLKLGFNWKNQNLFLYIFNFYLSFYPYLWSKKKNYWFLIIKFFKRWKPCCALKILLFIGADLICLKLCSSHFIQFFYPHTSTQSIYLFRFLFRILS